MAFSRKRAYAGPSRTWGAKRPRTARKRRVMRRGRTQFGRRAVQFNSIKGNVSSLGFSNRRPSKRAYKKRLWDASTAATHYRSVFTSATNSNTPASTANMSLVAYSVIPSNFWTVAGGAVDSTTPAADADLYIRGGLAFLKLYNTDSGTPMQVTVWRLRTSINGGVTVPVPPVPLSWDPTVVVDFQKNYRVIQRHDFMIHAQDTYELKWKIVSQKVDIDMFSAGNLRDVWVVGANNSNGAVTTLTTVTGHNLSYTGDFT